MEHSTKRQAWRAFLRAYAEVVPALEAEMERATDLPLHWYDILAQLHSTPDRRVRLQQLARSLVISKSGLTRRIDRMEAAGLVQRRGCEDDARGAFLELLPAGAQAFERSLPIHLEGIERHFLAHLTDAEAAAMASGLEKVIEAAEQQPIPAGTGCP